MIKDFENWYEKTYHKKVKVEYSTFGTNEDMYNQLTIGDTYDLICPSEYMTMKLMAENKILKYSDEFWDTSDANNYYAKGVSPYIKKSLDQEITERNFLIKIVQSSKIIIYVHTAEDS